MLIDILFGSTTNQRDNCHIVEVYRRFLIGTRIDKISFFIGPSQESYPNATSDILK